jgi:hypothetical protein
MMRKNGDDVFTCAQWQFIVVVRVIVQMRPRWAAPKPFPVDKEFIETVGSDAERKPDIGWQMETAPEKGVGVAGLLCRVRPYPTARPDMCIGPLPKIESVCVCVMVIKDISFENLATIL